MGNSHHCIIASTTGDATGNKSRLKRSVLINIVVAVGAVLVYQTVYGLIRPSHQNDYSPSVPASSPIERRNDIVERAPEGSFWSKIQPSPQLEWHTCGSGSRFKCALLETPLDYWNGTGGTAILAIAMLPAKVPITDPRYGGPILENPGGPGGSGTNLVLQIGDSIQTIVDTPGKPSQTTNKKDARYYDIVGLDPRGVGHSRPLASCFKTHLQRSEWRLRQYASGMPGSSSTATASLWGIINAYGQSCERLSESKDHNDNIIPFMTSASTARDMITFIDRYAIWRESEAQHSMNGKVPQRLQYLEGKEKLQFWGVSYGSFLGQTFASLFPERTGRIVLDGIVDTKDYIHGLWTDIVLDSEKTMSWFYSSCADAGPKVCALATPGSGASDIRTRVDAILDHLYRHPISGEGELPDIMTWTQAKLIIAQSLYSPLGWTSLATTLKMLEGVTSSSVLSAFKSQDYPACHNNDDAISDPQAAIACGDAYDRGQNFTLDDARAHYHRLYELSPTMAGAFTSVGLNCAAWRQNAMYSFRGPFAADADSGVVPILFIGNTADPVTPGRFAHQAARNYHGARALTQDSPGHSSAALPSSCTTRYIRNYYHTGKLPEEGTVCQPNQEPFATPGLGEGSMGALGTSVEAEDEALVAAHRKLGEFLAENQLGFGLGFGMM